MSALGLGVLSVNSNRRKYSWEYSSTYQHSTYLEQLVPFVQIHKRLWVTLFHKLNKIWSCGTSQRSKSQKLRFYPWDCILTTVGKSFAQIDKRKQIWVIDGIWIYSKFSKHNKIMEPYHLMYLTNNILW